MFITLIKQIRLSQKKYGSFLSGVVESDNYYLICKDYFLSGWGGAREKWHFHFVKCESMQQAKKLQTALKNAPAEQINPVLIIKGEPVASDKISHSFKNLELCPHWLDLMNK